MGTTVSCSEWTKRQACWVRDFPCGRVTLRSVRRYGTRTTRWGGQWRPVGGDAFEWTAFELPPEGRLTATAAKKAAERWAASQGGHADPDAPQ